MRKAAEYVVLWASVCLAGCADTTGPSMEEFLPADRSRVGGASSIDEHILAYSPDAPELETYQLRFWAVRGRESRVSIDYLEPGPRRHGDDDDGGWGGDGWGDGAGWRTHGDRDDDEEGGGSAATSRRFLLLEIPPFALRERPDGSRIAWGDSVEVTVSVDRRRFLVSLEPTGLTFDRRNPVRLTIWYHYANRVYGRDGDDDGEDDEIASNRLGLFYQDHGGFWRPCTADHVIDDRRFEGLLRHFSNYAVSW